MLGLGRLIPRDQEFFALFNDLATQLAATARLLVEATEHIQRGVSGIKRTKDVNATAIEVKRIEEEGDAIYHDAVEALFEGRPDPLDVIRWKEIYDHLEESIDSCMGIVHALQ